jgi:hypothetical protein
MLALLALPGCSPRKGDAPATAPETTPPAVGVTPIDEADETKPVEQVESRPPLPAGTADAEDVRAAQSLLDGLGPGPPISSNRAMSSRASPSRTVPR